MYSSVLTAGIKENCCTGSLCQCWTEGFFCQGQHVFQGQFSLLVADNGFHHFIILNFYRRGKRKKLPCTRRMRCLTRKGNIRGSPTTPWFPEIGSGRRVKLYLTYFYPVLPSRSLEQGTQSCLPLCPHNSLVQ